MCRSRFSAMHAPCWCTRTIDVKAILAVIGACTVLWWFVVYVLPPLKAAWNSIPHKLPAAWLGPIAMGLFFGGLSYVYKNETVTLGFKHLLIFLAMLSSFMTRSKNLAPSVCSIQMPRISFVPSGRMPRAM